MTRSELAAYLTDTYSTNGEHLFACDEIAEVLDKTGLTKEQKEIVGKIESKLSMIARQGRAFGIHLILALSVRMPIFFPVRSRTM